MELRDWLAPMMDTPNDTLIIVITADPNPSSPPLAAHQGLGITDAAHIISGTHLGTDRRIRRPVAWSYEDSSLVLMLPRPKVQYS